MDSYIAKLPQVPFGEMVDEILKRIGNSLGIKFEKYSYAVYESHKEYRKGVWTYDASYPPSIVLHRWIDSYCSEDRTIEFRDSGDSSQANLEKELKTEIESLMAIKIGN